MINQNPPNEYQYNYDLFNKISEQLKYPMASSVFFEDNSIAKEDWVEDVATLLLRIRSNQAMYDVAINQDRCSTLQLIFDIRLLYIIKSPELSSGIRKIYNSLIRKILTRPAPPTTKIGNVDKALDEYFITEQVKVIQKKIIAAPAGKSKLNINNYQDLFQIIYLPTVAYQAEQDKAFAAQRVAGANPLVIERLQTPLKEFLGKFPIEDKQYKSVMSGDDTLEKAFVEHRLYVTDYQVLSDIVPGMVEIEKNKDPVQKYIYDPIALFAVEPGNCPNRRLVPVAIQCYQNLAPQDHPNPLFIAPSIESSEEERWAWQIAKLTVQIADANYHEFISHLGGTHLRMEPIAISIYRKLPKEHPLGALLRPHIEGTLFINNAAVNGLVQPGGTVDKVAAGTLESSLSLSVKGAQNYPFSFNDSSLPNTLTERGIDNIEDLPNYPYRDDALLIWDAIEKWVSSYLNLFYADDCKNNIPIKDDSWLQDWIKKDVKTSVKNDSWLQDWIKDLTASEGGQMTGIGQKIDNNPATITTLTLDELIKTVTSIVFTGSAQHAAVNFPQSSFMTYIPNMPLAGYREAPRETNGISEQDYLDLLPPLCQAETQMNMTYLLGSLYYTKLGDYGDTYFTNIWRNKPAEFEVQELSGKLGGVEIELKKFQERLRAIELEIHARNEIRPIHYDFLLPSKIPQSINI